MFNWKSEQTAALCGVIRAHSDKVRDTDPDRINPDTADTSELLKVLARIIEGKPLYDAFGAPGGWGYSSPIGKALSELYKKPGIKVPRAPQPDEQFIDEASDADPGL